VKKFTVAFDCDQVVGQVEFGWTEVIASAEAGVTVPRAEQVVCSGLGQAGCPVRNAVAAPPHWDQCPRMRRLAARLGEAVLLVQANETVDQPPA